MTSVPFLTMLPVLTVDEHADYTATVAGARGWAEVARGMAGRRDRRADAIAAVRDWSPQQRRGAALALHAEAAASGVPCYYRRDPITVLAEYGFPGSRADLVWSLRLLDDELGLDDGRVYRFPATVAAGLGVAELEGLAPAVQAAFDQVLASHMPAATRRELLRLFGSGIMAATGCLIPPHLLHGGDGFGPAVRQDLDWLFAAAPVRPVLEHAASCPGPVPSAAWRTTAGTLPTEPAFLILDSFIAYGACLHPDTDWLLRGLVWTLASSADDESTALTGRTAVAGASIHARCGSPRAPLTAAAAVELLAQRPGAHATQLLETCAVSIGNKALLGRIHAALEARR